MPLARFRENLDPDEKRKEILWIALTFVIILAAWLGVVMMFGYRPLAVGITYDEAVLGVGVGVLLLCAVAYLAIREKESRLANRYLLGQLDLTISDLDERVRHLNALCSTSAELMGAHDDTAIGHTILSYFREVMGAVASLVFVDERTGLPVWRLTHPCEPNEPPDTQPDWPVPPSNQSESLITGPVAVADLDAEIRRWNEHPRVIAVSVAVRDGVRGVLFAMRRHSEPAFGQAQRSVATTLANMTSKAFETARLYRELHDSFLATVRSLVYSLDARDNYAVAHSWRVTDLAVRMAEHLGLDEEAIRDLETFAPLHDVGKIGVPDSILLKAGPLTKEEQDICRAHVVIGERIIRPLRPGDDAVAIVRNHHERWDGRGYPDGLAGPEIPLLARIVQVADCYDALISDRPYRALMTEGEALAHFRLNAGSAYDPMVVDALCAVLRQAPPPHRRPAPSARAAAKAGSPAARGFVEESEKTHVQR